MSKSAAMVLVAALVAVVAITFAVVYRGGGNVNVELPGGGSIGIGGKAQEVQAPGAIVGEDLNAAGAINAAGETGGDVQVRRADAGGDINLSTQNPGQAGRDGQ